jgi:hypothetical protein
MLVEMMRGGLRTQFLQPLAAMMILAGLALLAACVNVANLMLARATVRQEWSNRVTTSRRSLELEGRTTYGNDLGGRYLSVFWAISR